MFYASTVVSDMLAAFSYVLILGGNSSYFTVNRKNPIQFSYASSGDLYSAIYFIREIIAKAHLEFPAEKI